MKLYPHRNGTEASLRESIFHHIAGSEFQGDIDPIVERSFCQQVLEDFNAKLVATPARIYHDIMNFDDSVMFSYRHVAIPK